MAELSTPEHVCPPQDSGERQRPRDRLAALPPASLAGFVGREAEVEDAAVLLRRDDARPVTLSRASAERANGER